MIRELLMQTLADNVIGFAIGVGNQGMIGFTLFHECCLT